MEFTKKKIFIDFDHVKLVGENKPSFGKSWNEIQKTTKELMECISFFAISRDIFRCETTMIGVHLSLISKAMTSSFKILQP